MLVGKPAYLIPSRSIRLRSSLRARRTAAAFSRARFSLALQLLLERAQGLVDIVIANDDLHKIQHLTAIGQSPRKRRDTPSNLTKNAPNPLPDRLDWGRT